MFDETIMVVPPPREQQIVETLVDQPGREIQIPPQTLTPPTPEHARAMEAVFIAHEKETHAVAGLLGLWTGTLLMHDVARETFDDPADEKEDQLNPRKKPRPCC